MSALANENKGEEAARNVTNSQLTLYFICAALMTLGLFLVVGPAGIPLGIGIGGMIFCAVAAIQSAISRLRDQ